MLNKEISGLYNQANIRLIRYNNVYGFIMKLRYSTNQYISIHSRQTDLYSELDKRLKSLRLLKLDIIVNDTIKDTASRWRPADRDKPTPPAPAFVVPKYPRYRPKYPIIIQTVALTDAEVLEREVEGLVKQFTDGKITMEQLLMRVDIT